MRKYLLILLFYYFILNVNAQEAQNVADLDFLYKEIKKLPSYKIFAKSDKDYHTLYASIRTNFVDTNELDIYKKLYQLISPINDNHLGFYKVADTTISPKPIKIDLDVYDLKQILSQRTVSSLEGVYKRDDQEFVIFENSNNEFYVVHLETQTLVGILIETANESLDYISLINGNRGIVLLRNLRQVNGNFASLNLYKTKKPVFNNLPAAKTNFDFKHLSNNIGYLRLSSFYASNINTANSEKFLNEVRDSINTHHLIVDVRNNSGGGFKTSQRFIDFLLKYEGDVYVLQNSKTASNAEKFILRLKNSKKKIVTLGETTVGTLAYGSNFGKTISLPNHKFVFYPTDMNGNKIDLPYESIGIEPDVNLDSFTEDWIEQTIKYIKAND